MSLKRYFVWYFLLIVALSVITGVLFFSLNFSGIILVATVPSVTALFVAERFVKTEQRAPNISERKRITLGSYAIFAVIYILPVTVTLFFDFFGKVFDKQFTQAQLFLAGFPVTLSVMIMGALIYASLYFAYGPFARKRDRKLNGGVAKAFD